MTSPAALLEALLPFRGAQPVLLQRRTWQGRLIYMALVAVIAACYVAIPWERVSGQGFPDRDNYLAGIDVLAASGERPFDFSDVDTIALLMNEYLWRELLLIIGNYFQEPSSGLLVLSFLAVVLTIAQIIRSVGVSFTLVFLLAPLTVDLFMSQTRSALAVAVFMSALPHRGVITRGLLFAVAFLIHSFAAILILIYAANALVLRSTNVSTRMRLVLALLFGLGVSAVYAFLGQGILTAIGDRRADQEAILPASVTFAIWWIVLTCMLLSSATVESRSSVGQYAMTAIALQSMFICTTLFGVGGLRFLSLSLPFVFVTISSVRDATVRYVAVLGTVCFNLVHLYMWMS